eukprot:2216927-Pleurochrysis_carterae.AAC.2
MKATREVRQKKRSGSKDRILWRASPQGTKYTAPASLQPPQGEEGTTYVARWKWTACGKQITKGRPKQQPLGQSGRKGDSCAKASQWMRCQAQHAKPAKNLQDDLGDHVPALHAVLHLLKHRGQACDGRKQAKLSICESKGGPKSGEGSTTSGDGAEDLELEKLMVLCGGGVMHDTVRTCIQAVGGMEGDSSRMALAPCTVRMAAYHAWRVKAC